MRVAIVGKPNVGKSTLFNRLIGRRQSIVLNQPGVTKDSLISQCSFKNKKFILIDTAGFTPKIKETIDRTVYSLDGCDRILFVIDNLINEEDLLFANWLRKNSSNREIILVRNKRDYKIQDDCSSLGFDVDFQISAEHNLGIKDLQMYITKDIDHIDDINGGQISIAILGRPNVGKSTLMNKLSNSNRSLISEIAGTTRDPVSENIVHNNINFNLIDTAGLRRKSNVVNSVEIFSNSKALQIIKKVDIVLFLFDISNFTLEKQDFIIVNKILDSGRPIIVIANKSDKVEDADEITNFIKLQANKMLLNEVKVFSISSLNDLDFSQIIDECYALFKISRQRFTTGKLNNWLRKAIKDHQHPPVKSKMVNFKYMMQVRDHMIFNIFCNHPELLDGAYIKYLKNNFCKIFGINSAPIRLNFKKSSNPYN